MVDEFEASAQYPRKAAGCDRTEDRVASTVLLSRSRHRPISVALPDVSVHDGSRRGVLLRFARDPDLPLVSTRQLAAALAEASSGAFPHPHAA